MDNPKAILFDFADTILMEKRLDAEIGMARLLESAENPNNISSQEVQQLAVELYADLKPRKDSSLLELSWQAYSRQIFERLGIGLRKCPAEAELEFWQVSQVMIPAPGITQVLEMVSGHSIPLGVISNSAFTEATLGWELSQHDLSKWFCFLMSSADYGVRKPHPFIFLTASHKLGIDPGNIWFVGDSLEHDIAGALKVGMRAIWYNPGGLPCANLQPDAEIQHWDEFLKFFQDSL